MGCLVVGVSDQTRLTSLVEVTLSTAIGFVVSAAAWPFIAVMMGYPVTMAHTVIVTSIYTVLSIVRGYVVRRFFARGLHQSAVSIARRLFYASR